MILEICLYKISKYIRYIRVYHINFKKCMVCTACSMLCGARTKPHNMEQCHMLCNGCNKTKYSEITQRWKCKHNNTAKIFSMWSFACTMVSIHQNPGHRIHKKTQMTELHGTESKLLLLLLLLWRISISYLPIIISNYKAVICHPLKQSNCPMSHYQLKTLLVHLLLQMSKSFFVSIITIYIP